tara:strand:- start:308 stop:1240 length:933 start_codon:yes stop_codon:yes gene_type:complete
VSVQSRNRKRKQFKQTKKENAGVELLQSFSSLGIEFKKTTDFKKNLRTDLDMWPQNIIAGFREDNEIIIEYDTRKGPFQLGRVTDGYKPDVQKNLDELSSFFSEMKLGDQFTILNSVYDDGINKSTKDLEGTYTFISYPKIGKIVAKKQGSFPNNWNRKKLNGRHIELCPQFEKTEKPKSKKKVSSILNYLNDPSFKSLAATPEIGDILEVSGSKYNDQKYTIVSINTRKDGIEEISVTPQINETENRLANITKFKHYRRNKSIIKTADSSTVQSNIPSTTTTAASTTQSTTTSMPSSPSTPSMPSSGGY